MVEDVRVGPLALPRAAVEALAPHLAEIARRAPSTFGPIEAEGVTLDVGGPGVAYGVVRIRSGSGEVRLSAVDLAGFLEEAGIAPPPSPPVAPGAPVPAEAPGPPPAEVPAPPPAATRPPPVPREAATAGLASLLAEALGEANLVPDARLERAAEIVRRAGPNALRDLGRAIVDPAVPVDLKVRLLQLAGELEEKGLAAAVAAAISDPAIARAALEPEVRSGIVRTVLDLAGREAAPFLREYLRRAGAENEATLLAIDVAEALGDADALAGAAERFLKRSLEEGRPSPAVKIFMKRLAAWSQSPESRRHFEAVSQRLPRLPLKARSTLVALMVEEGIATSLRRLAARLRAVLRSTGGGASPPADHLDPYVSRHGRLATRSLPRRRR